VDATSSPARTDDATADSSSGAPPYGWYGGWEYAPLTGDTNVTQARAVYEEPQLLSTSASCGKNVSASFWTGLINNEATRAQSNASLEQDGTTAGPGAVPAEAFFELANGQPSDLNWTKKGGDDVVVHPRHRVAATVVYAGGTSNQANVFLETISARYHLVAYEPRPDIQDDEEPGFNEALSVVENPEEFPNGLNSPPQADTGLLHFRDVLFNATEGDQNTPYSSSDSVMADDGPLGDNTNTLSPSYVRVSGLANGTYNVRWLKGC
jgi:hypothetical protein